MIRLKLAASAAVSACLLLSGTMNAQAQDAQPDMDTFFSVEENRTQFEQAVSNGSLVEGRERIVKACSDAKARDAARNMDCACYEAELGGVSDEAFFYESMLTFREYEERVEALKNNDRDKFAELKEKHARRKGVFTRLKDKCG